MEGIRDNAPAERTSDDSDSTESKKDSKKNAPIRVPLPAVRSEEHLAPKPEPEKPSRFSEALAELSLKSREAAVSKAGESKAETEKAVQESRHDSKPDVTPPPYVHESVQDVSSNESLEDSVEDVDDDATEEPATETHKMAEPVLGHEQSTNSTPFPETILEPTSDTTEEMPDVDETELVADSDPAYEPLPEYMPRANELNSGEVIIPLDGDRTIEERVVLLRNTEVGQSEDTQHSEPAEAPPPFWNFQPQQQHQGRFETHDPTPQAVPETEPVVPDAEAPAGSDSNEAPEAPSSYSVPEGTMPFPTVSYVQETATPTTMPTSTPEKAATQKDVEDAIYYATKDGQRRGLITGLFVGGLYEHFKHKRREKKAEKRFKQQQKQLEQTRQDMKFGLQEQARQNAELQAKHETELKVAQQRSMQEVASSREVQPRFAVAETSVGETRQAHQTGESVLQAVGIEKQAKPEKLSIRTPEQVAAEDSDQLAVAEGHRLETSAWHTIEVDAKTGRAVENPTFEYGQEFYRERAKESLPPDLQPGSGGVQDDFAAASQIPSASTNGGALPPSDLPNATTQGAPSNPKDKAKAALLSLSKSKQADNLEQSGPIWPWLLALAVIVVLLIALL